MTISPNSKHYAHVLRAMQIRIAAPVLVAIIMLTSVGWTGQAWGETRLARVGILSFSSTADDPRLETFINAFRRELAERGWVEGRNVTFEYQSANGDSSQFAEAAAELVRQNVDIIMAASAPSLRAAYGATKTIPIVTTDLTTDPISLGYAESYARPGGNVTGLFLDAPEFAGKWFNLLQAMVPGLSRVAVLWDPAPGTTHLKAVRSVAKSLDIKLQIVEVQKPGELDAAFSVLRGRPQAVILLPSPTIFGNSERLAALALKHRLPATSMALDFATSGGLIAYGPDLEDPFERSADFVARILDGADPADLPIERPSKFRLLVNLETARTLGLKIPQSILLGADEVIR
jgi:putative tryptophan/tyrosine transport system substrate-binding protein